MYLAFSSNIKQVIQGNVEHNLTGSSSRFSFRDYFVDHDNTLRDTMDGITPSRCHGVSI